MYIIRPITMHDFETLEGFAHAAALGMTGLPRNRNALQHKIGKSIESFEREVTTPIDEHYQFILEDISTGKIGGTCGVSSRTGILNPHYYYKIENIHPHSSTLAVPKTMSLLRVVSYSNGPSEIRALYLAPQLRREGLGRLLSLSRFLFMAAFPKRFATTTFAEMRGFLDSEERSPFWEHVGRHFLDIDFADLMLLLTTGRSFIPDMIPQYPLYVSLLPKEAQQVIGVTHENAKPALRMLHQQGFTDTKEVDLFDAGPKISAVTAEIASIKHSSTATVAKITTNEATTSKTHIMSNERLTFRACVGGVVATNPQEVSISEECAHALEVGAGDVIRFIRSHHQEIHS